MSARLQVLPQPEPAPRAPEALGERPLAVRGLTLRYGRNPPAVEEVEFAVAAGELVSLVGPSGCGKSTILRAIAGLHRPERGTVELGVARRALGFLFQDDALLPWRTARDNVALGLRFAGMSRREARAEAEAWLARLGLAGLGGRYPAQLSGGQRKRVALAQVLALRPRLLLMDEPFAALDAIVRQQVTQELLRWVEREGIAVVLVTHDLEEAIALADRVLLLGQGPRARIQARHPVDIPRPRDLVAVRGHPAFAPLYRRLWRDLSRAMGREETP